VVLGIQFSSCHYIPAISFVGTTPNFDKIHITADLVCHGRVVLFGFLS
jgi:hypothetical protein